MASKNPAKITLCGYAGVGKTSAGKRLADALGYQFISTGNLFRMMAAERGVPLNAFEAEATANSEIDRELDAKMRDFGVSNTDFVMEARLGWRNVPDGLGIFLACGDSIRFSRIASREGITFDEARERTERRERLMHDRYQRLYNIETLDVSERFTIYLRTDTLDEDQVFQHLIRLVSMYGRSSQLRLAENSI